MIFSFKEIMEETANDPRIKEAGLEYKNVSFILKEYFAALKLTISEGFLTYYFKGVQLLPYINIIVSPKYLKKKNKDGELINKYTKAKQDYEQRIKGRTRKS